MMQQVQTNPAMLLQQAFTHIQHNKMADLPIVNNKLQVAVVGMQPWQNHWLGILLTPWTMSIILVSGDQQALPQLKLNEKATWSFPAGDYEFMGLPVEAVGYCHLCSLMSPVFEFQSQQDALGAAQAALAALLQAPDDNEQAQQVETALDKMRLENKSITAVPISRRNFLRGTFLTAK